MSLQGRIAVVTGGASGIGRAICHALAQRGANIAVADIDYGAAKTTADGIRTGSLVALPVQMDVSDSNAVHHAIQTVLKRFDKVDILVNNAGICPLTAFEVLTEAEWDHVLAVNLKGAFLCSQAVIHSMKRQNWGRIISISSVAGKTGGVLTGVHYSASKGGIIGMTMCLARCYARSGITSNVVAPGATATGLTRDWSDQTKESIVSQIPMGRFGRPEDIAAAVAFLASEEACFITGEVLDVNGGFMMD